MNISVEGDESRASQDGSGEASTAEPESTPAKKRRATTSRRRAAAPVATPEAASSGEPSGDPEPESQPAPRKTSRRRPAAKAALTTEPGTDSPAEPATEDAAASAEIGSESTPETAPARRRAPARRKKAAAPAAEEQEPAAASEQADAEAGVETETAAPKATRRKTKAPSGSAGKKSRTTSKNDAGDAGSAEAVAAGETASAEDSPVRAAEAESSGSRRRGSGAKKKRSSEQEIDVLAAFSAAEPSTSPEDDESDEAGEPGDVRLPATALLFQAPTPDRTRARNVRRARQEEADEAESEDVVIDVADVAEEKPARRSRAPRADDTPVVAQEEDASEDEAEVDEDEESAEEQGGSASRRRRRRGGRGRRKSGQRGQTDDSDGSSADSSDDEDEPASGNDQKTEADSDEDRSEDESGSGSSRRRRRRRRGGRDNSDSDSLSDEITALKGSTRLEAKRQRRRDGRDASRRRTTITEAEFLARRESVDRDMIVRETDGRTQIAVLEDGVLVEHYVAKRSQTSMVGNVYLGRVQNVLPSMEAAFVDLGKGRNAVLYAGEVNWDAAGLEGQPRRIEQALSSGDTVLVQVTKDPIGHKGARLTAQITLAGRYLVYVPSGAMTGISRKLPENERARLKKLLKEIVPEGAGVIVRTAAEGATEEQLRDDVQRLADQWKQIEKKQSSTKSAPVLVRGEPELAVRVVRDVFNEDFRSLHVQGEDAWQTISEYVRSLAPDLADRMHQWVSAKDIFSEHRIDEQLTKGMDRKVWLPSGGSLIIDRTEAMTVVDVNTGKFTGSGGTLEETVTKNNLEAAEEIVRQLRLRDIGGIIVIDFIDMVLESNRDLVLRRLVECLGRDRTRHQVAEVTSLGLVQMTRKRVGQGLVEAFSEPCAHCGGRGYILHDHPVDSAGGGNKSADGGGRRRGKRGKNSAGNTAGSEVKTPADDPSARAAREAVKVTLATIAQAAANAHQDEDGETVESDGEGDVPAIGQEADVETAGTDAPAAPVEAPDQDVAQDRASTRALDEEPESSEETRPPAASRGTGRRRGGRRATGAQGTPADPVNAAPASADESAREQASPPAAEPEDDSSARAARAVAAALSASAAERHTGQENGQPGSEGSGGEDVPAGSATSEGGESSPRRGGRRPRRAATSGPVTT